MQIKLMLGLKLSTRNYKKTHICETLYLFNHYQKRKIYFNEVTNLSYLQVIDQSHFFFNPWFMQKCNNN